MRILVADDDPGVPLALDLLFRREKIESKSVASPGDALAVARSESFDVFLLDLNYTKDTTSGAEGLSLLSQLRAEHPRTPVVVMTGWASIEGAVDAMRRGASDYVPKPWDNARLIELLRRLTTSAPAGDALQGPVFGESAAMQKVLWTVQQVAFSDVSVLVTGEHGTGKEIIARTIHGRSGRKGEFVAVNAGALPDTMLESELFGHVRGAFTDARSVRRGAFERAQDGTVFLDEIANMPMTQQAKLLRALQEKQFQPLGASTPVKSTARVVSATNADIHAEIAAGRFRMDLLYRLNTIHVHLAPLRERREEIPTLARHFAREAAARYGVPVAELSPAVLAVLAANDWPGNVRELEHAVQRAVLLSVPTGGLEPHHFALTPAPGTQRPLPAPAAGGTTLKDAERAAILEALERHPDDRLAAARSLGLSRSAFYRRLQQLGIKRLR